MITDMTDEEIIAERDKALDFWSEFGADILYRLNSDKVRICEYRMLSTERLEPGIIFEQVRYRKHDEDGIRTKWLKKPLGKKKDLIRGRIWLFLPIAIVPSKKRPYELKEAAYIYLMGVSRSEDSKTEPEYERIITRWNGTPVKKKTASNAKNDSDPYKFAFPKRYISKVNRILEKDYLPRLWAGSNSAFWHQPQEGDPCYMGTLGLSIEGATEKVEHLKEICNTSAGAVLVAYTCFSVLKPFFSSYPQLNQQSPYLQVKKRIENMVAVNIWSHLPEYAERLVQCCCGYFDLNAKHFIGPVIDGISIQSNPSGHLVLSVDQFERSVLQPACVLWVNRAPAEDLLASGRIISLKIDNTVLPKDTWMEISQYLVASLAKSFSQNWSTIKKDMVYESEEKKTYAIEYFKYNIDAFAKKHLISLESINLNAELTNIIKSKNYSSARKCAERLVLRIKLGVPGYTSIFSGMDQQAVANSKTFLRRLDQMSVCFKKELREGYQTDIPAQYWYKEVIKTLRGNVLSHKLNNCILKKIAYLSTSFRIFAELCLSEADQELLIGQVDHALISTLVKQTRRDCAQDILEDYLSDLIQGGRYARVRGTTKDREDIAVWYDPGRDEFLLPAGTYFTGIKDRLDKGMTKRGFEESLSQERVISTKLCRNSDREQDRRSKMRTLMAEGKKEAVLVIPQANLSKFFRKKTSVKLAIEEMCADPAPLRCKKR